jgi:Ca2+-binding EF-hand superfamily protein
MRLIKLLVVGLFVGLAVAPAQDGRGGGQPGQPGFGRGPGRGRPSVAFTVLDVNADGVLDAQEIAAAPASLAKLDKNSDGQITSDEVRPAMPEGRGRGGPGRGEEQEGDSPAQLADDTVKALMAFDANGDGKLSRAELPPRFQGIFDRGDTNKDGFLTPDEIRKALAAQTPPPDAEGRGGRGGGEGGRGEGGRGEGRGGEMNFIRMDPILAAVDSNGDGVISAEEIRNSAAAIRKLDKDGDGKVTREEAMPPGGRGRQN